MARITVEDCIDKFPSRFELVLVASQRARKLHSGDTPTVEKDNDKNTVIALREIGDSSISVHDMKENLIQEYQTVTISDEEEENFQLESANSDEKVDSIPEPSQEVEEEMKDLVKSEDSEIKGQYEVNENPSIIENDEIQIESPPVQENNEIQAESPPVQENNEIQAESDN